MKFILTELYELCQFVIDWLRPTDTLEWICAALVSLAILAALVHLQLHYLAN